MTRQVTDQLYIELDYYYPEEYYVYIAEAASAQNLSADLSCSAGTIKDAVSALTVAVSVTATSEAIRPGTSALSSSLSVTADANSTKLYAVSLSVLSTQTTQAFRIIETAASFTSAFAPTLTATAFKNHTAIFVATASLTTAPVVNRSAQITLSNIINQNSQAVKTAVFAAQYQVTATQATQAAKTTDTTSSINSTFNQSVNGGKLKLVQAGFVNNTTLITTKTFGTGRPRIYTTSGSPTVNTSIKKFGAGSLKVSGSNFVSVPASPDWLQAQTIDLWFYVDSADVGGGATQHNLLVWGTSLSAFTRLLIDGSGGAGGGISGITVDSNTSLFWTRTITTSRPAFNAWHHLRVLDDGSNITIWFNGSKQTPSSYTYVSPGLPQNRELRLGTLADLGQAVYIDELLITKQQLTASSTTSFAVPTDRWKPTDQSQIYLLSHYDTDFSDDVGVFESASSTLTATGTISITADPITKSAAATLSAVTTQTTQVTALKIAEAALTSTVTVAAVITRQRDFASAFTATVTESAVIGSIKQSASAIDSAFTSTLTADITARAFVDLESTADISVTAVKTTDIISLQSVSVSQSASMLYTAGAASAQSATVSQTAVAERIRSVDSAQTVTATQSATANKIPPFSGIFQVTATITAETTKFRPFQSDLQATATVSATVAKITDTVAAQTAQTTQTAINLRIRDADSTQTVAFAQTTQAVKTATTTASLSQSATQSAIAVKTADGVISAGALFSPTVTADITARPLVFLESQSTVTAIIGVIKQFQGERAIQGVKFEPDTFIQLLRQNDLTSLPRTTANFLVAFWAYAPNGAVLDHFSHSIYDQGNIKVFPTAVRWRDVASNYAVVDGQLAPQFGDGAGYEIVWNYVSTENWNHYILYRENSSADIKLYINGVDQGLPDLGPAQAGVLGLESPRADGTGNRRLQWSIGADAVWWYESVNELTEAARSISPMQGGLTQLVVYFDSLVPDATDAVVRGRFYDGGRRDLGPQGTDTGLSAPRIYLDLDTFDDFQNKGTYQLDYVRWREITTESYDPIWDNINWTLTQEYTATAIDLVNPGFIVTARLTGGFIGVFQYTANLTAVTAVSVITDKVRAAASTQSATVSQASTVNYVADHQVVLISTVSETASLSVTRQAQASLSVSAGFAAQSGEELQFSADLASTVTVSTSAVLNASAVSTLLAEFTQAEIIERIRSAESTQSVAVTQSTTGFRLQESTSAHVVTATVTADIDKLKLAEVTMISAVSQTTEITALKPAEAALTLGFQTATNAVKTADSESDLTLAVTQVTAAFKATGIIADLTVINSTLALVDIINIDPSLQLRILSETRQLTILSETRVLTVY